jgi:membrane-associated phospholipid phosphatase
MESPAPFRASPRLQRLLQADRDYSARLRYAEKPGRLRRLAIFLAHSGDSWFWGIGLAAVWLLAGPDGKTFAVRLALAIVGLAVVVLAVKRVFRRPRPKGEWGAIYRKTDPHSFPSGHAARMAMLVVLAAALGPAWLAWLLLIWAPLVALARVAMGVHYLSDVIGGALVGIAVGLALAVVWR